MIQVKELFHMEYLNKINQGLNNETINSYFYPAFNKALQSAVACNDIDSCKKIFEIRQILIPELIPELEVSWHDTDDEEYFVDCAMLYVISESNFWHVVELGVRPRDLTEILNIVNSKRDIEKLKEFVQKFDSLELYEFMDQTYDFIKENFGDIEDVT